jgi:murein DD-endopeptidase MepM/ murein hydrolase activator NlpD
MKKGYSIVVTSTESGTSKYFFLSRKQFSVIAVIAGIILVFVIVAVISYSSVYYRAMEAIVLKRRNAEMEAEFAKLEEIRKNLEIAETRNQQLQVMLGIQESPPPVGPVTPEQNHEYTERVSMMAHKEDNIPSVLPAQGQISRNFSPEHRGVDIAAPRFSPVIAAASGKIQETGWDSVFGNYVIIEHDVNYSTFYGHLQTTAVNTNASVACGEVIGSVGSTGRSTSPHLHYEIRFQDKPVEPLGYMPFLVQH